MQRQTDAMIFTTNMKIIRYKSYSFCNFLTRCASKEKGRRDPDFGVRMKINETSVDSVIRIFASVLLLYLGFGGELAGALAIAADILGVMLLLTGVIGFCPIYALFGFHRRKK